MSEPRELTDDGAREMARHIRDAHWRFAEMAAAHDPLWWCWWNKNRHHDAKTAPPDLYISGLIDGLELRDWMAAHPEWWVIGKWDDGRYAAPVRITDAGRAALANRDAYDMEPVTGGLVEPGWRATPAPRPEAPCP